MYIVECIYVILLLFILYTPGVEIEIAIGDSGQSKSTRVNHRLTGTHSRHLIVNVSLTKYKIFNQSIDSQNLKRLREILVKF